MSKLFNKQGYTIYHEHQLLEDAKTAGVDVYDTKKFITWLLEDSEYRVIKYYDDDLVWYQRVNRVWFCPLYLLLVAPIKWVITGSTGIDGRSVFRNLMRKLVGL